MFTRTFTPRLFEDEYSARLLTSSQQYFSPRVHNPCFSHQKQMTIFCLCLSYFLGRHERMMFVTKAANTRISGCDACFQRFLQIPSNNMAFAMKSLAFSKVEQTSSDFFRRTCNCLSWNERFLTKTEVKPRQKNFLRFKNSQYCTTMLLVK